MVNTLRWRGRNVYCDARKFDPAAPPGAMRSGLIENTERPHIDRRTRLQIPAQRVLKRDPLLRRCDWGEVNLGFRDRASAQLEASRCIQCPGAPCVKACPVHNDIPGALQELERGNLIGAAEIFRRTNTMPEVCGRICPQERLCQGSCVVGHQKRDPSAVPVAIGRLEAFVADNKCV